MEADPLFIPARANFGENLRLMGDPAASIREQTRALEQDPRNLAFVTPVLSLAQMNAGDLAGARRTLERVRGEQPQNYLFRLLWALQLALEGKREEALVQMHPEVLKYGELVPVALYTAEFYAVLGEKSRSIDWLDRAVRAGDERVEWFERDPLLANIREEPRFRQILESIRARRAQRAQSKQ